jgi:integrase
LRKFVEVIGNKLLKDVTPYDIALYLSGRLREVSASKVNMDFRTLRAAFNRALKFNMIETNPFHSCSNVTLPDKQPAFLSRGEFQALLRVIDDDQIRAIVILAACTAMRLGEIANLKWKSVDLDRGFIHLENEPRARLKNRKRRSVPLNREAQRVLLSQPHASEYVFVDREGKPKRGKRISEKFKAYARKAGLPEAVHFHTLRHTGATWLVESGVPLPYVKEICGHSSINVTMIYAHSTGEHLKESVGRLDKFVWN